MLFLLTTSLSQDWVIYAPAAFLRNGSRFSADPTARRSRKLSPDLPSDSRPGSSLRQGFRQGADYILGPEAHQHLVCELHGRKILSLGCRLPTYPLKFYHPTDITPPAARCVATRRGLKGFRDSRRFDGVAASHATSRALAPLARFECLIRG
jgi:hypothetical protein